MAVMLKNLLANAGDIKDVCSIPGSGRSPEEGNGNPLQYSCLENPMDGGAWQATVHEVPKSDYHYHFLRTSEDKIRLSVEGWGSG